MTGSGIDVIVIPIVAALSLAFWLIVVAYAASHPRWRHGPSARGQAEESVAPRAPAGDAAASERPAQPDTGYRSAA